MDLTFTPEEQRFRDEVRAFLDASLPAAMRHKVLEGLHVPPEDTIEWQRILFRKGWVGPDWPPSSAAPAGIRCGSTSSRRSAPPPARRGCFPSA